ncbi:hypothetical protein LDENG_00130500 [Lucifuga dentata]|nr:hypothetical protein LDENG_00130500 [Lucifuga dentata]
MINAICDPIIDIPLCTNAGARPCPVMFRRPWTGTCGPACKQRLPRTDNRCYRSFCYTFESPSVSSCCHKESFLSWPLAP